MIDAHLEAKIRYLMSLYADKASAARGTGRRRWADFIRSVNVDGEEARKDVDVTSMQQVRELFTREPATRRFFEALRSENPKYASLQLERLAIDYLAALERYFRARYRTRIRSFAHAAAANNMESTEYGGLYGATIGVAKRLAGPATPQE